VHFNGATNTQVVIDWFLKNFEKPSHVALGGSSAGALGVLAWADHIISNVRDNNPHSKMTVLVDSYSGFLAPNQGEGVLLARACQNRLIPDDLMEDCRNGKLMVYENVVRTTRKYPDVPFAHINAKLDAAQIIFYCIGK